MFRGKTLCVMSVLISSAMLFSEPIPRSNANGRVVDPSGAAIAGAHIAASFSDRLIAAGVTNAQGEFSLRLPPADYSLKVSAPGFADSVVRLVVTADSSTSVDVQLQIINHDELVTVTEAPTYQTLATDSATRTPTLILNVPQSISMVDRSLIQDKMMLSIADVVQYVPGITAIQGENNRDQLVIRGNSSSADFFVNGVRDDVQYYRDLYNTERVEALKGPNAMIFGRGGGGGVINRVTKEAGFTDLHEISLQGGAFGDRRFATDLDHTFKDKAAVRLNAMYENSDSFRDFVGLERYGFTPTVTFSPNQTTRVALSYEYFHDGRTADRGIPSYRGLPADLTISTFFGNPSDSNVRADVNLGSVSVEHQFGHINFHNRTLIGDYDRGYQNFVPGATTTDKTLVALSAYNNATARRNVFNQTDLTTSINAGPTRHTFVWGAEFGQQNSSNFRNTGYFNNTATSITVPYQNPVISTPVTFRQSATDADNKVTTNVAAGYFQDQVEVTRFVQLIVGVRVDRFNLDFHNRRTGESLSRIDTLLSPRAGIVLKPIAAVSVYANYSVSYLPSSGDQFSSLTTITQQVKPEKFSNYETGIKWDVRRNLSLTAAAYRLDRTNTRSTDPNYPTRIIQTGSQRTNGFELGWTGSLTNRWKVAGGYAWQDAFIRSGTVSALSGAQVAQVPHHTFSLWNSYQILPRLSAGAGLLNRADMFAGVDNTVTLPGYTRADAAVYYSITERIRFQANVENLLDKKYYMNADNNNNISPGSPRAFRVGLIARF